MGALVADAASLGLHWIYDPARIEEVAGEAPEFVEPDIAHYRGVTGYFAHGAKQAGDSTHYGEQMLVCLRSLAAMGGELDTTDYERRFFDSFGPGGAWVGYIDYATRVTLRNVDQDLYKSRVASKLIELAHDLNVATVVEGIESRGEWEWAKEHGAEFAQGYLFARPNAVPPVVQDNFELVEIGGGFDSITAEQLDNTPVSSTMDVE